MKRFDFGKKKAPKLPTDTGEFMVFRFDENDDVVEASPLVFTMRGLAEQYARDKVDPKFDPFVASASKKESKNGNQEGENPYA